MKIMTWFFLLQSISKLTFTGTVTGNLTGCSSFTGISTTYFYFISKLTFMGTVTGNVTGYSSFMGISTTYFYFTGTVTGCLILMLQDFRVLRELAQHIYILRELLQDVTFLKEKLQESNILRDFDVHPHQNPGKSI